MERKEAKRRLPLPGQRIVRTVLGIWLCFLIYLLRGRSGMPFFSAIAAMQCIQPDTRSMRPVIQNSIIGTFVGGLWGLVLLLIETRLVGESIPDAGIHLLLMGLFAGLVLYFCVLLKIQETAYFSAVVMLSVAINLGGDAGPVLYMLHRMTDTLIGIAVAELINRLHLPRVRDTETLFLSGLNDTLVGAGHPLSPYARVELNRMIDDGAKFTIATMQTPATVRELLDGVALPYPVIAMDGAALYDMNRREFLAVVELSDEQAERIAAFLREEGLPFFISTLEDQTVLVRFSELKNEAIRRTFEEKRRSPYRNFVHYRGEALHHVLYFMVMAEKEQVERAAEKLRRRPWIGEYRLAHDVMQEHDGYACLKICSARASRDEMRKKLEALLGTKGTVTFGSREGACDVYIASADRDRMVKELKRRFEPVDIRGWRTMLRK